MSVKQLSRNEISIESTENDVCGLTISGLSEEFSQSSEKVQRLLDLLDVPKGTKITVTSKASTSIVR